MEKGYKKKRQSRGGEKKGEIVREGEVCPGEGKRHESEEKEESNGLVSYL